mmetsp:Transcript_37533/g.57510  ORF Transcript_37533/g.57510 Transcript_37533/m.57510 type:complete len:110 (-) Transcript_37533:1092-1421(-)
MLRRFHKKQKRKDSLAEVEDLLQDFEIPASKVDPKAIKEHLDQITEFISSNLQEEMEEYVASLVKKSAETKKVKFEAEEEEKEEPASRPRKYSEAISVQSNNTEEEIFV